MNRVRSILLTAAILIFLSLIIITNLFHYNYQMNADLASDAVLSKLIWDSKEIIPDTWYIAAETRIICTPNLAALFYGITHNMVLSIGMACCFMTILIAISICYFGRKTGLNMEEAGVFLFLGLSLFLNMNLLEVLYLFASYYAVHVILFFVTVSVYIESIRKHQINWVNGICVLPALLLGMQGTRGILILYGPLFGVEVIRNVYRMYCKEKPEKQDWQAAIWVCVMLLISFVGTSFQFSVSQTISRNIRNGFHKLFTVVLPDIGKALGFPIANPYQKLCMMALLLLVLYLLIHLFCRMIKKEKLEAADWGFLMVCSSPVVSALMVAFTTVESSERYYFLLIYAMAYAVALVWHKWKNNWKIAAGVMFAIWAFYSAATIYLPILKCEEPPETAVSQVGKWLEENEYDTAYATFENANTITVLTNGKVRAAAVDSVEKMNICKWMSSTEWYVPNVPFEKRTAYVITESEREEFEQFLKEHEDQMEFGTQIGKYVIYTSDYNFSRLE